MKKILLTTVLLIGALTSFNAIEAQNANAKANIGRQPAWGPVGYDYVDYYYFPDINCYFNVNQNLFTYLSNGKWITSKYLPSSYRNYDLYGMYKVTLVGVTDPWKNNATHVKDYAHFKGVKTQAVIRDSQDTRYKDSRNNKVAWYSSKKNTTNNQTNVKKTTKKVQPSNNVKSTNNNNNNIKNNNNNNPNNVKRDDVKMQPNNSGSR